MSSSQTDEQAGLAPRKPGRKLLKLPFRPFGFLKKFMPTGLYSRSLIIVIAPMVLLQAFVTYIFLERHWELVTERLSTGVVREVSFLIDAHEDIGTGDISQTLSRLAHRDLGLSIAFLPGEKLPDTPSSDTGLLDATLSSEIERRIDRPYWIDTAGTGFVDIRVDYGGGILRVLAPRSHVYAHNSHIFVVWMVSASVILLVVAVLFLRNQIKPIERLASAAEALGMGRDMPFFKPSGASEVRRASAAFIEMRRRIQRQMEQRTEMLNGVSHDLRTPLTRFKLQLALLPPSQEVDDLRADVDEMEQMLEDYLGYARGEHDGESAETTDVGALLEEIVGDFARQGHAIEIDLDGDLLLPIKRQAFKRCVANIVENACKYADTVWVSAERQNGRVMVIVDDDGAGIPQEKAEEVFRPFVRLDAARNLDEGGTGLGLAIARDIVRGHGGDIRLSRSPKGGLRASIWVPV